MEYNLHNNVSTIKVDYDQTITSVKIDQESEARDHSTNTLDNVTVESDEPLFNSLIANVNKSASRAARVIDYLGITHTGAGRTIKFHP